MSSTNKQTSGLYSSLPPIQRDGSAGHARHLARGVECHRDGVERQPNDSNPSHRAIHRDFHMAPRTRRTRGPTLPRPPASLCQHGPRAPEHPPTPPRRFGRSSSSPEDPVPATSGHQSPAPPTTPSLPDQEQRPSPRCEDGACCRSTRPRACGQLDICPSRQHGAWQPATGNPGRGPDPPVRLHHPPPLPLMSDGDQQGRRCLVQDAPSPVSHASRASRLHSTTSPLQTARSPFRPRPAPRDDDDTPHHGPHRAGMRLGSVYCRPDRCCRRPEFHHRVRRRLARLRRK